MATASNKYNCKFCGNGYKEKFNFDRHIGFCEFSYKSAKEIDNEIEAFEKAPSVSELFAFVKELTVRVGKLEKENIELKQFAYKQKKRVDIVDWLNNRCEYIPELTFNRWMTELPVESYLHKVFEYDLLTALIKCLDDAFEKNSEKLPICAFSQKTGTFYVYDNSINCLGQNFKWSQISNKQLDKWFSFMAKKIIAAFKNWYEENKTTIDSDEKYKEQYFEYFQKVLGGKMNDETRNHRLRQFCYTKLKQNLKTVVELDFV
jgi:hypothetical protein